MNPWLRGVRLLGAAALLCLVAWGTLELDRRARRGAGIDFYQFWVVPHAVRDYPNINIYSAQDRKKVGLAFFQRAGESGSREMIKAAHVRREAIRLNGSPLRYAAFAPFVTQDFGRDLRVFRRISIVAALFLAAFLGWTAGLSWLATLAVVAGTVWFSMPIKGDLAVANVNTLQMAIMCVAIWLIAQPEAKGHVILGGALLVFAGLFKLSLGPTVLFLWLAFLVHGRLKQLGWLTVGMLLGAGLALVATYWLYGTFEGWLRYLPSLANEASQSPGKKIVHFNPDNSVTRSFKRFVLDHYGVKLGFGYSLALMATSVAVMWRGRNWARESDPVTEPERWRRQLVLLAGFGLTTTLLGTPLVQGHHLVILLPLSIVILNPARIEGDEDGVQRFVVCFIAGLCLLGTFIGPLSDMLSRAQEARLAALATLFIYILGARQLIRQSAARLWPLRPRET